MSTRADRYTQLQKIPDLFSDFLNDLTPHPITKDVSRARNDQTIKQSIKNLVLTNYGERLFQPTIGSRVNYSLFEPNDIFMQNDLENSITQVISQNEPRAIVNSVDAIPTNQDDSVSINIVFSLINNPQPQNLEIILRRVR
jgi:phage baseplate assembly protein W